MTALVQPLAEAGVKLPTIPKRIWLALVELGAKGATVAELEHRMRGVGRDVLSTSIRDMHDRGMVYRKEEPKRRGQPRAAFRYFTDMTEFQMLPRPPKAAPVAKRDRKAVLKDGTAPDPAAKATALLSAYDPQSPLLQMLQGEASKASGFEETYAASTAALMSAIAKAGGDPISMLDLTVGQFLVVASRNRIALSARKV